MLKTPITVLMMLSALLCPGKTDDSAKIVRYDFAQKDSFERNWRFYGAKPLVNKTQFYLERKVSAEDGRILVIEANEATGFLFTIPRGVDLQKLPIMRWRWRVIRNLSLPANAKDPDDQPGVVYLGDGSTWQQYSLGYRWECNSRLGEESFVKYRGGLSTVKRFCIRNRSTTEGQWVVEERNVLKDFKAAFKRPPAEDFVLCLGANSQHSNSNTRIEIDYIEFRPAAAPEQ